MSEVLKSYYYPDMMADENTLKKSLLLFDELHFTDRPSFMLKNGGSIGALSPLRSYEKKFRDDGVPFYVHALIGGKIEGEAEKQVHYDINNPNFLQEYQNGLASSTTFKNIQIPKGNYGNGKTQLDEIRLLVGANLDAINHRYENASDLLNDESVQIFGVDEEINLLKRLVFAAALTSVKITSAMTIAGKEGVVPLADAAPYRKLLSTRYAKACEDLNKYDAQISKADICLSIIEEFIPNSRLAHISFKEVVEIRKKSETQRKQFLKYVAEIQNKQSAFDVNRNYSASLQNLIESEVRPAAEEYKNCLKGLNDSLFASAIKTVVTAEGVQQALSLFAGLTWHDLFIIGIASSAHLIHEAVDRIKEKRAIKRDCSLSYILDLDV